MSKGILSLVEEWAVAVLAALTEEGSPLAGEKAFKTVERWTGQVKSGGSGVESMDALAPFAFVMAHVGRVEREGGHDANLAILLEVSIGQADDAPGAARFGSDAVIGIQRLFEKVFIAIDNHQPKEGGEDYADVSCDPFYLAENEIMVEHPKKAAWQMTFTANWIKPN
jgi:hypothetical protein